MKTQVIQLESHDDIISVRDKMAWGKTTRILLIWPKDGHILERRLDLVLAQRYCQQSGAQLGLVSSNDEVTGFAKALSIPVFASVTQAQKLPWRRGRARKRLFRRRPGKEADIDLLRKQVNNAIPSPMDKPWVRLAAFTAGILAVLTLILFFLPGARVELQFPRRDQSLTMDVWANPGVRVSSLSGAIPAKITSVIVEGNDEVPSSGSLNLPATNAQGLVRFSNIIENKVELPVGLVVATTSDPVIRFVTVNPATVPAGSGQAVDVAVKAVLPGNYGNIPPGQIQVIEGPLGLELSVQNMEPMQGGSDLNVPMPVESDYNQLSRRLNLNLQKIALDKIKATLITGQSVIPASLTKKNILKETREPPEGKPSDRLKLTLQIEFTAWTYSDENVQSAVRVALDASRPSDQVVVPDSLFITPLGEPTLTLDTARWQVQAVQKVRPVYSPESVTRLITGKKPDQAKSILLNQLKLIAPAQITISPSWWPYLPFLPFRIQVEGK
jgi:Baseplate J-like protein